MVRRDLFREVGMARSIFTEEELAEIRAADAEIERADLPVTWEEIQAARKRDIQARRDAVADERKAADLERHRQYYHKHKAAQAASKALWRQAHKKEIAEYNRRYYAANKERLKAIRKAKGLEREDRHGDPDL